MNSDPRTQIQASLAALASERPFRAAASELFGALGYTSDRELDNSIEEFLESQGAADDGFRGRALVAEWKQSALLHQITDDEIRAIAAGPGLFDGGATFQPQRAGSFLFAAIDLQKSAYPRAELAAITRTVNGRFPMPVILLFRHGATVTIAIERTRVNKRDKSRDVSEKVTLIKDIRCENPIRAHLDILGDLALGALYHDTPFTNFEGLRDAWEKQLDAYQVTKRFYREVTSWYFWAQKHAKVVFPRSVTEENDRSLFLIRLLTRLIFCWFLQEKGLIPPDIFRAHVAKRIVKSNSAESGDYYRAVLQNLFFATLNQEIDNRRFVDRTNVFQGKAVDYGITNLWRYENLLSDKAKLLAIFAQIPFVNGGLFDCLDRSEEKYRGDDFSEHADNPVNFPWELFFGAEQRVDLSDEYGDTRRRTETVRGLFEIFGRYKFTVEENTPLEEEIALDPELLGHVFENLSAEFNQETGTAARKATGSFYTPRAVVSFMVDEALILYLSNELKGERGVDADTLEDRLRTLFGTHEAAFNLFNPIEVRLIVRNIDNVRILDPACGSGAFPMGALQRLVDLLTRLDPESRAWREVQRERALNESSDAYREVDREERKARLEEIEAVFTNNTEDYGRKLYLIENCLYGVDIQPIATQIAKLRFFIALIVDQKVDLTKPNFNVRPLPNLETRIVAADSLNFVKTNADAKGEQGEVQYAFFRNEIDDLREELQQVRHKYFTARRTQEKSKYRKKDAALRAKIAELLEKDLKDADDAYRLAYWDPYDQNSHADFFDPAWMFGIAVGNGQPHEPPPTVTGKFGFVNDAAGQGELAPETEPNASGFDIVIGNPPYVRQEKIRERKPTLQKNYATYTGMADLYVYFYERSVRLLKPGGVLSFITSNKWYRARYGKELRAWLLENVDFRRIVDFDDADVFEAIAYPTIVIAQRSAGTAGSQIQVLNWSHGKDISGFADRVLEESFALAQSSLGTDAWQLGDLGVQSILAKLAAAGMPLGKYVEGKLFYGIKTGLNEAFIVDGSTRSQLIATDAKSAEVIKPYLQGRDIKRWDAQHEDTYVIFTRRGIAIDKYPAIKAYLANWQEDLTPKKSSSDKRGRKPGRYKWYEIQDEIAYFAEFDSPKITWGNLATKPQFAMAAEGLHVNAPANIITADSRTLSYLLGVLNSSVTQYFISLNAATRQGGFIEYKPMYVEQVPIPNPDDALKQRIAEVANDCQTAAAHALEVLPALEAELNALVYQAYGLTAEEIAIIEGKEVGDTA